MLNHTIHPLLIFLIFLSLASSSINVGLAVNGKVVGRKLAGENPFTAKASVIRYWKKQISNDLPKPWFLLNKASPLDAVQLATFSKLADENSLSTQLPIFCSKANLLCFPDVSPSLEKHEKDVNFVSYDFQNFTNYGNRNGGFDSFKNYSDGQNIPLDTFRRYSHGAVHHDDRFANYGPDSNVNDQRFNSYGTGAIDGKGDFINYNIDVNVPGLKFTSYTDGGSGRKQDFKSYSTNANAGDETFTSYGKHGNLAGNAFNSYGNNSNVVGSNFNSYGENGNVVNDTFSSYGFDGNVPENKFKNYGENGNAPIEVFKSYRDQSNVGDDSFESYGKKSNAADLKFSNYGKSFNEGTDKFTGYGKSASFPKVDFKIYGVNNTFKEYTKSGVHFASYVDKNNNSNNKNPAGASMDTLSSATEKKVKNNRWVEPGKFFREKMLKKGTVMPMPDIRDKMPKRSFLPRKILSKLPFSTSKIDELKKIFHADDESRMADMMSDSLSECERPPSRGETKRCVGSVEDMIDFATSVLGRNVVVGTTENTEGSDGKKIMIGSVKGINGGKTTKSVSCHQSLFPYLLYYCHSVPDVRVYEADLLDPNSKSKINHGFAICHIDTSAWSPTHGAFLALGSEPGKIEVCHWIFENDMTWTVAD